MKYMGSLLVRNIVLDGALCWFSGFLRMLARVDFPGFPLLCIYFVLLSGRLLLSFVMNVRKKCKFST